MVNYCNLNFYYKLLTQYSRKKEITLKLKYGNITKIGNGWLLSLPED